MKHSGETGHKRTQERWLSCGDSGSCGRSKSSDDHQCSGRQPPTIHFEGRIRIQVDTRQGAVITKMWHRIEKHGFSFSWHIVKLRIKGWRYGYGELQSSNRRLIPRGQCDTATRREWDRVSQGVFTRPLSVLPTGKCSGL